MKKCKQNMSPEELRAEMVRSLSKTQEGDTMQIMQEIAIPGITYPVDPSDLDR